MDKIEEAFRAAMGEASADACMAGDAPRWLGDMLDRMAEDPDLFVRAVAFGWLRPEDVEAETAARDARIAAMRCAQAGRGPAASDGEVFLVPIDWRPSGRR